MRAPVEGKAALLASRLEFGLGHWLMPLAAIIGAAGDDPAHPAQIGPLRHHRSHQRVLAHARGADNGNETPRGHAARPGAKALTSTSRSQTRPRAASS